MASVRKRGATWHVTWRDAAGVQRSEAWRTEKKAHARKAEIERLKRDGNPVRPPAMLTVGELWERWIASKTTVADTTLLSLSTSRKRLEPLAKIRVVSLTRDLVRAWAVENAKTCKPASHNKCLGHLRACLRWGVLEGIIHENAADGVGGVRDEFRERTFLTGAQVELLAAAIDQRYRSWVLLVAWTGLRFSEAAGLRWSDVNLETGAVTITSQAARNAAGAIQRRETKTGRARRTVYAPLSVIAELQRPVDAADSDPIFTRPRGSLLAASWFTAKVFNPAVEKVGLVGVTPHALRHSAASLLAASGASVAEAMHALGHARSSLFLELYAHLFVETGVTVAARLEELRAASIVAAQSEIARLLPTDSANTANGSVRSGAVRRTKKTRSEAIDAGR